MDVLTTMDECQAENLSSGAHVYATIEETLEVEDLAKLTGMVFCQAAGADLALVSLNEWKEGVSSRQENAGLPTGWYGTLQTYSFTGARIKELYQGRVDWRAS